MAGNGGRMKERDAQDAPPYPAAINIHKAKESLSSHDSIL